MINNLYFIDEAENDMGRCLVLKAPWTDELIEVVRQENISVLRLTESMGWKGKDISFLEKLEGTGLRGVEVYAWDVKDVTPLQFISNLEYLGLQCEFAKAPDFSTFNNLKVCKLFWRPKAKTIFGCYGLRLLNIVNYPSVDLHDIRNIMGLERLQISSRKLASLSGIEELQSLKVLDLAGCPKLESLSNIEKCQQLRTVELENCKKVYDVSSLGELENLRNIVITDCGKVKSLRPLVNCKLLESLIFVGDSNLEDDDLTTLMKLPKLQKVVSNLKS